MNIKNTLIFDLNDEIKNILLFITLRTNTCIGGLKAQGILCQSFQCLTNLIRLFPGLY